MLTHDENQMLCRVEGDAIMGQLIRRHWIPALLTEQVAEPDGNPVRLRLFGGDLVAFRDTQGRVGVIGEFCAHRKASLFFGRNEECGLRCLYHGWKFDVNGSITEMPSEPKESGFAERVKHKAYPTREAGGFVWAYMGPADQMPEFESPPWGPTPDARVSIVRMDLPCNWAQIMEGQIDSAHSSSLHASDMRPARVETAGASDTHWTRPSTDKNPRIQVQVTNYGMRYAAIRRPIKNAQTHDYVRITTYVAPFTALIPPNSSYNVASVIVPKDDVSSYFHFIAWGYGDNVIEQNAWRKFCVAEPGVDLDADFKPALRFVSNNYLQDRQAMKEGNFTGIPGIPNQDIAMWESMGRIADRTSERLGASDIAVIQFRRLLLDAVVRFRDGAQPIGLGAPHLPQAKLRSYHGIVAKTANWRTLGAEAEEISYLDGMEEDETDREMATARTHTSQAGRARPALCSRPAPGPAQPCRGVVRHQRRAAAHRRRCLPRHLRASRAAAVRAHGVGAHGHRWPAGALLVPRRPVEPANGGAARYPNRLQQAGCRARLRRGGHVQRHGAPDAPWAGAILLFARPLPGGGQLTFSSGISTRDLAATQLRYFRGRGLTRIAIITSTDASGTDALKHLKELAGLEENRDIQIVAETTFNPADLSAAAQMQPLKAAQPQALIAWSTGAAIGTVFKAILDAGLDIPVATTNGNMTYAFMEQFADVLPKQLYIPSAAWPQTTRSELPASVDMAKRQFFAAFEGSGIAPDGASTFAWDPALLVVTPFQAPSRRPAAWSGGTARYCLCLLPVQQRHRARFAAGGADGQAEWAGGWRRRPPTRRAG